MLERERRDVKPGSMVPVGLSSVAAGNGHLHVLKYLHENGCPWNEGTCSSAAKGGHLDVLKYARENGCPWNRRDCRVRASKGGHTHVVSWIDSQPSLD